MPSFRDIFDAQTSNCVSQIKTLNDRALAAGWNVLHPEEAILLNDETPSLVISGVTWSKPDLELLDELATRDTSGTRVWFFNPDYVLPDERILPGTPRVVQTPVLAEYAGKRLVSFLQGGSVSGA